MKMWYTIKYLFYALPKEVIGLRNKTVVGCVLRMLIGLLSMVPVVLLVWWLLAGALRQEQAPVLLQEITVEAGTLRLSASDFRTDPQSPAPKFLRGLSHRQLNTPGSHSVILTCGGFEYEAVVHVVDTVAPAGKAVEVTSLGELPEPEAFVTDIRDITAVTVTYETEPDLTKHGQQTVALLLTDTSGNSSRLEAMLTVDLDITPPQIHGVQTFLVYQDDTVSYRAGVSVSDDRDANPVLSVDASGVDLSQPGEYSVIYTAKDASGNVTTVETTVTVRQKQPGYVPLETIYAEVDAILANIIEEDMTAREQVTAIYNWVRKNCGYVNHSDKSDYLQGAYVMMSQRKGDCFNYYALCKLMYDRLGIPNIDVRKVKNYPGDSDHYWSLVSLDGGATWYHVDSVPRVGNDPGFLLVTDAYMDAYSKENNNCFNRDKSLYPPTP